MEEQFLYQKISVAVRQEILSGQLKPGDRLPSIRQMLEQWDCTPGTVQRAYQELARQGLVVSRSGKGTHVVGKPDVRDDTPLRRAVLTNRAEAFLLEVLTTGYSLAEVENALQFALDRWRAASIKPVSKTARTFRFAGSHDPMVSWIAAHFPAVMGNTPGNDANPAEVFEDRLQVEFTGSLGGLIALAQGKADLAGCHLWDAETDGYNVPFVRRLLPGRQVALLTLAHRRLGLIVPSGNPAGMENLRDLARPGLRFVNRQSGSGTRVWLDASLHRAGIQPVTIHGYDDERNTHSDVARVVAQGDADVGFGLESAALSLGLDFIYLVRERYDLIIPGQELSNLQPLVKWVQSSAACEVMGELGGYDTEHTGRLEWIE